MRILIYTDALCYMRGNTGGVRKYAETIKAGLEGHGHHCDWFYEAPLQTLESYDVVHIFSSFYANLRFFRLARSRVPVVISPIYDPMVDRKWQIKALLVASKLPGLCSNHGARKEMIESADYVFTMSEYERCKLADDYSLEFESADLLFPCRYKTFGPRNPTKDLLFIGDIGNPRQNIKTLIAAVADTELSLTLIGGCSDHKIIELVEECSNITYLGYVTEEEKVNQIQNHKVFVMPAYTSGFGIGAVEAAEYGLMIVYTKYGGTFNYVNSSAIAVDPYSRTDLRSACKRAVDVTTAGCLREHTTADLIENLVNGYQKANKQFTKRKSASSP